MVRYMKICFLTRVDAFDKNGGDTYQIEMYKKYLEQDLHTITIISDLHIPLNQDCYIIVNLDRQIELIYYYDQLYLNGLLSKTLLLTIHHDFEQIDFYEKKIRAGRIGMVLRMFDNHYKREKLKNIYRGLKYKSLRYQAVRQLFINYEKKLKIIIENVAGVILIAPDEQITIEKDLNIKLKKNYTVYNGVNIVNKVDFDDEDWQSRDIDVLITGRIEPRKNSLAIAHFFSNKNNNYKVTFVGNENPNAHKYCDDFKKLVDKNNNIEYIGGVPSEQMPAIYARAKINLSASWFEVASLVDLESYAYGCHVISSRNGNTHNYLGDRACYLHPKKLADLSEIIPILLKTPTESQEQYEFISVNFNWKKSAENVFKAITVML